MENAELIQRCKEGDKEAMEFLYRRYRFTMMGIIRRYLHEDENAEDVLHDGFILIFSRIGEVRNPASLKVWMASVFKNLCLDYLASLDVTSLLEEEPDIIDVPELDEIIPYEELVGIINRLPKGYRDVFRLAVLENKSHKEIGKILGINPHSSSSQLFHARRMLQKMVTERKRELGLISLLTAITTALLIFSKNEKMLISPDSSGEIAGVTKVIKSHGDNTTAKPATQNNLPLNILKATGNNTFPLPTNTEPASENGILPEETDRTPNNLSDETADNSNNLSDGEGGTPCEYPEEGISEIRKEVEKGVQTEKAETDTVSAEPLEKLNFSYSEYPTPGILASGKGEKRKGSHGWNFSMGYNFGGLSSLQVGELSVSTPPPEGSDFTNPGDVTIGGGEDDDEGKKDESGTETRSRGASNLPPGSYPEDVENDFPLTISFSISKRITPKLSLTSGLDYTLANTSFHLITPYGDAKRKIRTQYIGIPFKIRYEFLTVSRLSLSAGGGVAIDFPVKSDMTENKEFSIGVTTVPNTKPRTQFSLSVGAGIQFNFNSHFGIYVEPSVRYNFKNNSPLPTYWQQHRLGFSIPFGIRAGW